MHDDHLDRRTLLRGAMGTASALAMAGCGGSSGCNGLSPGDAVQGRITEVSPEPPTGGIGERYWYCHEGGEQRIAIEVTATGFVPSVLLVDTEGHPWPLLNSRQDGNTWTFVETVYAEGRFEVWVTVGGGTWNGSYTLTLTELDSAEN